MCLNMYTELKKQCGLTGNTISYVTTPQTQPLLLIKQINFNLSNN
jgi:hypothetical protein